MLVVFLDVNRSRIVIGRRKKAVNIFQMYSPKYSKAQSCAYFCFKNALVALNTLYIVSILENFSTLSQSFNESRELLNGEIESSQSVLRGIWWLFKAFYQIFYGNLLRFLSVNVSKSD